MQNILDFEVNLDSDDNIHTIKNRLEAILGGKFKPHQDEEKYEDEIAFEFDFLGMNFELFSEENETESNLPKFRHYLSATPQSEILMASTDDFSYVDISSYVLFILKADGETGWYIPEDTHEGNQQGLKI